MSRKVIRNYSMNGKGDGEWKREAMMIFNGHTEVMQARPCVECARYVPGPWCEGSIEDREDCFRPAGTLMIYEEEPV